MRRGSPGGRTALLSFQSHGDRSFLDGRETALLSGDLRESGIDNEILHAVLDPRDGEASERRLVGALGAYDVVVFERVWSADLIARLRAAHPDAVWVWWQGEHTLADPPADWVSTGAERHVVPALLRFLRHRAALPPAEARFASPEGFVSAPGAVPAPPIASRFAPNLRPILIDPDAPPGYRTFSVVGNRGCPYQADARANPLYAGVEMPAGMGRGCAFCTTGNVYQPQPHAETAERVMAEIRYLREHAPEIEHLVLLDQHPFAYLPEMIGALGRERVRPFTLLLETRADWMRRAGPRFERALERARDAGLRIAPFLVGVESFSQAELDRFNKGLTVEENLAFLETLWAWADRFAPALSLDHCAFGFVLLTPWTTREDLRANLEGIRRTHLDRLRGSLLVSRVRLYSDTALYYLARHDGLLAASFGSPEEDSSGRYGYYPSHPWRYLQPDVAHFSTLAAELTREMGGREQVRLFEALLAALDATTEWRQVTAADVRAALAASTPRSAQLEGDAPPELRERLSKLIQPLALDATFAHGWRFGRLTVAEGRLRLRLERAPGEDLRVDLLPRRGGPSFATSRHYEIVHLGAEVTDAQSKALRALCRAILSNDA